MYFVVKIVSGYLPIFLSGKIGREFQMLNRRKLCKYCMLVVKTHEGFGSSAVFLWGAGKLW